MSVASYTETDISESPYTLAKQTLTTNCRLWWKNWINNMRKISLNTHTIKHRQTAARTAGINIDNLVLCEEIHQLNIYQRFGDR